MTVRRFGFGVVDLERTCVVPECRTFAPAEPHQTTWPTEAAKLRARADVLAAEADKLRAEAAEVDRRIKEAVVSAWMCQAHRRHLHDPVLRAAWGGGRHDADATAVIERTRAYLQDPNHQSTGGGACMVCRPGTKHRDEVPA